MQVNYEFNSFRWDHFAGHQSHASVHGGNARRLVVNLKNRRYAFRTTDVESTITEINLSVNGADFGPASRTRANEFKGTATDEAIDVAFGWANEDAADPLEITIQLGGWVKGGKRIRWIGNPSRNRGSFGGVRGTGDVTFFLGHRAPHDVGRRVLVHCNGQTFDGGIILQTRAPNKHWGPRTRITREVWNALFHVMPADSLGWSMLRNQEPPE